MKASAANYTVEKLADGSYMVKTYYPENNTISRLETFKSKHLQIRHGLYQSRWDDGTLTTSGKYENNEKVGKWIENTFESGFYEQGLKQGDWAYYRSDSTLMRKESYLKGKLHGNLIVFDSLGNMEHQDVYQFGERISTTKQVTTVDVNEELPRFQGAKI